MTYVSPLNIEISDEVRKRMETLSKEMHNLWLDTFISTREVTTHKCNKCGTTHPDIKSARMCVEQCTSSFKSPDEYYRSQANGRTTSQIKR